MPDISFAIALPDKWIEFEGPGADSEAMLWENLDPRITAAFGVDTAETRRTLAWWLRQAKVRGLAMVAAYAEPVEGDAPIASRVDEPQHRGAEELAGPTHIGAMVALAFVTRTFLSGDDLSTVNPGVLITALELSDEPGWEPLQPPGRIELPAGTAVERLRLFRTGDLRLIEAAYYLPLFDGQLVAMVSFLTPSLFVAEEFLDLFQTIISTLEVFDETEISAPQP